MTRRPSFAGLRTEQRNRRARDLDTLSTAELVGLFHQADTEAIEAIGKAAVPLRNAIDAVTESFQQGGRLIYVGAGTSGRLGALDAAECPPTFSTKPRQVQAIIAGGARALRRAIEGAEDDRATAQRQMRDKRVSTRDVVCGITASGVTPFVRSALDQAAKLGAVTVLICAADPAHVRGAADIRICLNVGPELIAGSTRMKAGLATKSVLHTITSAAMIRSGRVFDNVMVDVNPTNRKLRARAARIVQQIAGTTEAAARSLLRRAGYRPKVAIVMHRLQLSPREAERRLAESAGRLRSALEQRNV